MTNTIETVTTCPLSSHRPEVIATVIDHDYGCKDERGRNVGGQVRTWEDDPGVWVAYLSATRGGERYQAGKRLGTFASAEAALSAGRSALARQAKRYAKKYGK